MPLAKFVESRRSTSSPKQAYIDYATVLLAGSAGRFLGLEMHLAYPKPHLDIQRLERAHLAESAQCIEPETDRAFSIIVGQLHDVHDGDAAATFAAFWSRAIQILPQPNQAHRMAKLFEAIRRRRELKGQEIDDVLKI